MTSKKVHWPQERPPYQPLTAEEAEFLVMLRRSNNIDGLARYVGVELDADNARRLGETSLATERLLAEALLEDEKRQTDGTGDLT